MRPFTLAVFVLFAFQTLAQDFYEGVQQIGKIQHYAITESSGLIPSRRYPGVLWTHNDSGNPFLFAIDQHGKFIGAFHIPSAKLIDWEDVAIDNQGYLYLSDSGSNHMLRRHVAVHRIA